MTMLLAITRPVSASLAQCELTHLAREPIAIDRAAIQHAAYEQLLESLGAKIQQVPAAPELPDAVFVEDTAIVLDEVAIITRPGAVSRRAETAAVAALLANHRPLLSMQDPATLDGGDVLRAGRVLYVGRSSRTTDEGIAQLQSLVAPWSYRVVPVELTGCLHLKSAVTLIAPDMLLINPACVQADAFPGLHPLPIDPAEPLAANALRIYDTLVFPTDFPRTAARLSNHGFEISLIDCSELAKAEGAVTCCCILVEIPTGSPFATPNRHSGSIAET